jgi:hypothetical protein
VSLAEVEQEAGSATGSHLDRRWALLQTPCFLLKAWGATARFALWKMGLSSVGAGVRDLAALL